jgi:hypothetical protein
VLLQPNRSVSSPFQQSSMVLVLISMTPDWLAEITYSMVHT